MPKKRELNPFKKVLLLISNRKVGRFCLAFFLFFLAFNGFTAILVLYFKEIFKWGPELSTTAFLIVGIVATIVQGGLIGPLVKRYGEKKLTLIGLLLVITGCIIIPLTQPEKAQLYIFTAVGILAFGTGLVTPSLRSLVSKRFDSEGQGVALGSLQALQSLGSFIGPPLAGICYDLLGPTSPFLGASIIVILVITLIRENPKRGLSEHETVSRKI